MTLFDLGMLSMAAIAIWGVISFFLNCRKSK